MRDALEQARVCLCKAQEDEGRAQDALQGLYQHAAALRLMQELTRSIQDAQDGLSQIESDARAKGRLVVAAEQPHAEAKAAFDVSVEAFKREQESVARAEAAVRNSEQVCFMALASHAS
jgi:hypothetical protein